MPQYKYGIYNPGQYPADVQEQWDTLSAQGWHVHTAMPAYTEICILWEFDGPAARLADAAEIQAADVQRKQQAEDPPPKQPKSSSKASE